MQNKLFQYSTIVSLVNGNYDGELKFSEAMKNGNFGVGTFHALNGEMIAIDGEFFQMLSDGSIRNVDPEMTSPFLSICDFKATKSFGNISVNSDDLIDVIVDEPNKNKVVAVRIDGEFSKVSTRTVSIQEKPYKKMFEIQSLQSDMIFENIKGSVVGFYTPKFLNTVGVDGIHNHFISDDRQSGGHVKSFSIENANVSICVLDGVDLTFGQKSFSEENVQDHIKTVEGERD